MILREKNELKGDRPSTSSREAEKVSLGKRKRSETVSSDDDTSESSSSESESEEGSVSSESSDEGSDDEKEENGDASPLIDETAKKSENKDDDSESSEDSTDSDDSQDSTSSSSEAESDSELTTSSSCSTSNNEPAKVQNVPIKPPVPPGQGLERTRLRNQRKLRAKKLKQLIAEGILPENSSLIDLTNYENRLQDEYSFGEYNTESRPCALQSQPEVEEDLSQIKSEEGKQKVGPPRRIDVAAVSRFIKAGLVGNDGYDRAREEARARGKEKKIVPDDNKPGPPPAIQVFIPRTVTSKNQRASDVITQGSSHIKAMDQQPKIHENLSEELPLGNPLIIGFYEQIELAARHRESLEKVVSTSIANNHKPSAAETEPANIVVRAFECEPEWCGLANAQEGEEVDSVEIDPPYLPFVDNYRPQKRRAEPLVRINASPSKPNVPTTNKESLAQLSEEEILRLQKLESPIIGAAVYFKSMFLHPFRFEPVVLWRWGKIIGVDSGSVTIDVYGPTFKDEDEGEDEEAEEGEVRVSEETLVWTELLDVRRHKAD